MISFGSGLGLSSAMPTRWDNFGMWDIALEVSGDESRYVELSEKIRNFNK